MTRSELNHLRRLLAWVRCEIGQDPAELVALVKDFAAKGVDLSTPRAHQALVEAHDKARRAPEYVRAALKALGKVVDGKGAIVDEDETVPRRIQSGRSTGGAE